MTFPSGTQFRFRLQEDKIILEPLVTSPVDALYGKYSHADLLTDLEAEHRQEISDEAPIRA